MLLSSVAMGWFLHNGSTGIKYVKALQKTNILQILFQHKTLIFEIIYK